MTKNLFTAFDEFQYPVENATVKLIQNSEKQIYWDLNIGCGDLISKGLDEEDYDEMCDQPSPGFSIMLDGNKKISGGSFKINREDNESIYVVGSHFSIIQACLKFENTSYEHLLLMVKGKFDINGESYPFLITTVVKHETTDLQQP